MGQYRALLSVLTLWALIDLVSLVQLFRHANPALKGTVWVLELQCAAIVIALAAPMWIVWRRGAQLTSDARRVVLSMMIVYYIGISAALNLSNTLLLQ